MNDMSWARKSKSYILRYIVARKDFLAERDLSWARTDSCKHIREYAAAADYYADKDLAWAKTDSSKVIRNLVELQKKKWKAYQQKEK